MMGYNILEPENLPEALKDKPRWVTFLALLIAIVVVTISSVSIGVFFGYTYCYIEHRSGVGIKTGNFSQATNLHIVHFHTPDSVEAKANHTINGANSNLVLSRILKVGRALFQEDSGCITVNDVSRPL